MKYYSLIILIILITTSAFAAPSKITKSDNCKIHETDTFEDEEVLAFDLQNEDIKVTCKFRGKDSSKMFRLYALPTFENISGKLLYISYNAAFFDKENNLIACIRQNSEIQPDTNDTQFSSALTHLPKSEFEKISSYKLVIYIEEIVKE